MTESALVRAILLRYGSHPQCRLWRSQPLVARTKTGRVVRALPVGHPDISGIKYPGLAVFIECKAEGGRLSSPQLAFQSMALRFGAIYVCARAVEAVSIALGLP